MMMLMQLLLMIMLNASNCHEVSTQPICKRT
jgi:hypothetical protein